MKKYLTLVLLLFSFAFCIAQENMVTAAAAFLKSLSTDQKAKAVYPFSDEQRFNWHFYPKDNRIGISINELDEAQRKAALTLMHTSLSDAGYKKVTDIMKLENILKELENRGENDHFRDPGKYFFTIFGEPSANNLWGWRVEGHHISFTFSSEKNRLVSATPGALGANPAIVPSGPEKGKQILREEAELGFDLLHSFNEEQLKKALWQGDAPNEILTLVSRKPIIENKKGISYSEMNASQQQKFLALINVYIDRSTKLFADDMRKELKDAGLDKLIFSWAGAQQPQIGKAHYYCIQGPTIIIEYDNSQNNANHAHSVLRDLKHDFGDDPLLEHYKASH